MRLRIVKILALDPQVSSQHSFVIGLLHKLFLWKTQKDLNRSLNYLGKAPFKGVCKTLHKNPLKQDYQTNYPQRSSIKISYQRLSNNLRMETSHLHLTKLVTFLQRYQIPVMWVDFFDMIHFSGKFTRLSLVWILP